MWVGFFFSSFVSPLSLVFLLSYPSYLLAHVTASSGPIYFSTLPLCEGWIENCGGIVFFQTLLLLECVAVVSCMRRQAVGKLQGSPPGDPQRKDGGGQGCAERSMSPASEAEPGER